MRDLKVVANRLDIVNFSEIDLVSLAGEQKKIICPVRGDGTYYCRINCASFVKTSNGLLYCTATSPCPSFIGRIEGSNAEPPEFNLDFWNKKTLL